MADAVIDMNCPPPFLDQHQELLEHAREAIISILPVIDEKGLTLDEIVVLAADPTMAERVGRPPVSVSLLEAVLANVTDPDTRRRLMTTPEPGFVRVGVFAGPSMLILNMCVRGEPLFVIRDVVEPSE